MRILFCFIVIGVGALSAVAAPPNVILVMTDDQGYGDFGATGNELIRTPHLDAMAERSATMTTFYVSPVCSPTRASLMTGRYNYRTRVVDTWIGRSMMEPDEVTVAEVLRDAGYATGIFGKWHLGDSYPMRAIDQGFEEALVHRGGGLAQPADHPENEGHYTDPWLYHNGIPTKTKGYCTDVYFDAAMDFIAKQEKPFFTYIAMNAPHGPYHDVPETLRKEYDQVPLETLSKRPIAEERLAGEKDKLSRIAAMITNVDENMGRLFTFLGDHKLTENTLVIFLTDNGPNTDRFAGPFRGVKSDVYDGGVRTPIWFQWPARLKAKSTSDTLSAHIDLMPSILEACEVTVPNEIRLDGRSVLPLLENKKTDWPSRTITLQTHRGPRPKRYHHFMTRDQRWKLVHSSGFGRQEFKGEPKFELYDLENDPGEQTNLAAKQPEILERLRKDYDAWFDDVSSTRPDNYAPPVIQVATPHENPTTFTRQDWFGKAWNDRAMGHWVGDFRGDHSYEITVYLYDSAEFGRVSLKLDNMILRQEAEIGAAFVRFENIRVPSGTRRIEAFVEYPDKKTYANQIDFYRK